MGGKRHPPGLSSTTRAVQQTLEQPFNADGARPMPDPLIFSGFSDSGKTTFVSRVVSILARRGRRVGVIKHHGHRGGEAIHPHGRDTHRHLEAGAVTSIVSGAGEAAIFPAQPGDPGPLALAASMKNMDLVLAEGFKYRRGWKIEVLGPGREPALTDDPLLLAVAGREDDRRRMQDQGLQIRWLDVDDPATTADFITACFCPPDRLGPVPDRETCFGYWARYTMFPNIMIHSMVVTEGAKHIAAGLVRGGRTLDLPVVEAGALLHDIAKTECLVEDCPHGERGHDVLVAMGYPGVAKVVQDHIDPRQAEERQGLISPSVVVNYADKRVLHDRLVSQADRAEDLIVRYGTTDLRRARLAEIIAYGTDLERRLFDNMVDLRPGDLARVNEQFARIQQPQQ